MYAVYSDFYRPPFGGPIDQIPVAAAWTHISILLPLRFYPWVFPSPPSLLTHSCDGRRITPLLSREWNRYACRRRSQLIVHNSKHICGNWNSYSSLTVSLTHPSEMGKRRAIGYAEIEFVEYFSLKMKIKKHSREECINKTGGNGWIELETCPTNFLGYFGRIGSYQRNKVKAEGGGNKGK